MMTPEEKQIREKAIKFFRDKERQYREKGNSEMNNTLAAIYAAAATKLETDSNAPIPVIEERSM